MNFSILIPSFNDLRIIETIKSIQNQTISKEKVQIVIFDSKSKEDLIKQIRSILGAEDKLIVEEDDGIFDGINKGIKRCDNELIFTIGSDDKLASNYILEKIQNEFITGNYDYLCTSTAYTDENWNKKIIEETPYIDGKKHGTQRKYFKCCQRLKFQGGWSNGKPVGEHRTFVGIRGTDEHHLHKIENFEYGEKVNEEIFYEI